MRIVFTLCGVSLLLLCSCNAARNNFTPPPLPPPAAPAQVQPPPPQPVVLFDQTFHVAERSYVSFRIEMNRLARVKGRFTAQGGRNDIACLILDDDNLVNFRNGNAFRQYYGSDYTTIGNPDVVLGPGVYHVVFDNRKAFLTSKTVAAKFTAE